MGKESDKVRIDAYTGGAAVARILLCSVDIRSANPRSGVETVTVTARATVMEVWMMTAAGGLIIATIVTDLTIPTCRALRFYSTLHSVRSPLLLGVLAVGHAVLCKWKRSQQASPAMTVSLTNM